MWKIVGPFFARQKINAWLAAPGPRILNLGGGANLFDRWLTADVDPRADVYVDFSRPLPFPDDCVDVVYLEEVIEHLSQSDGLRLVSECLRVFRPDGRIRLTTPDLDALTMPKQGDLARERQLNEMFYSHEHRHIYSPAGIQLLLSTAGFSGIQRSSFRDSRTTLGSFDTHPYKIRLFGTRCDAILGSTQKCASFAKRQHSTGVRIELKDPAGTIISILWHRHTVALRDGGSACEEFPS